MEINLLELNKHREQTAKDILKLLKTNDRVGCVRYTGYGKSYFVVRKLIERLNDNVLIVVPNSYLYGQYNETYESMNNVKVVTYQSLKNIKDEKLEELKNYTYIISDECHHLLAPKWGKEFERIRIYLNAKVIGLTATPLRGDGKNIIEKYFNNIQVEPLELIDGIARGFIPKIKYIIAYAQIDDKYDKKLSEIDRYKVQNLLNVQNIIKKHIPEEKLKHNLKIPVYVPRVKDIHDAKIQCYKWFSEIYSDKDINIYSISSTDTKKHINNMLKLFKQSNSDRAIDIMISIDMLKEGLHLPSMGVEIMLRKTKSLVTYFQQIGRVVNDDEPIVFDLINNQKHLYNIKKEYKDKVVHLENWGTEPGKVMFNNCIDLIDETVEIENIFELYNTKNYNTFESIEKIIEANLSFIVENCHMYTMCGMSNKLNISPDAFRHHICDSKYEKYNIKFKSINSDIIMSNLLLKNKEYIESNPDNLTCSQFAKKFNTHTGTFIRKCKKLNIDIVYSKPTLATPIILKNKEYIESNPDNLTKKEMYKYLGVSLASFYNICEKYNIDTETNYDGIPVPYNDALKIICKNKKFIELNPNNLTKLEMQVYLGVSGTAFYKICRDEGIDISSNYSYQRNRNENIKLILDNKYYIENNPDKLTKIKMCKKVCKLGMNSFKEICSKNNIDITTNYKR